MGQLRAIRPTGRTGPDRTGPHHIVILTQLETDGRAPHEMATPANGFGLRVSPTDGQIEHSRRIDVAEYIVELRFMEPMTGIEPAYSAWEADVLPLNYIGMFEQEG